MNKCILIGNLTRDPELQSAGGSGVMVCKFGLAVNRNFTNSQGEREADFFNIVAWRGLGENCGKYLTKGSKVAVSGRVETRTYEKDGVRHHATDIVADDVQFLNTKKDGEGGSFDSERKPAAAKKPTDKLSPVEDEGLPF
ncbi:MAG: single-stranded DNA-binding protein [Firmicutes bacterium]|nr:single-stranded DNA-binding protein [Bacillota bacterium]